MTIKIFAPGALALALSLTPFTSANATGDERHHYAPQQSGVPVNKPVLTPVEQKFADLRNTIEALRRAKTSSERNKLLNSQAASLDALQGLLAGNSAPAPAPAAAPQNDMTQQRLDRLEYSVQQIQRALDQMWRR